MMMMTTNDNHNYDELSMTPTTMIQQRQLWQ